MNHYNFLAFVIQMEYNDILIHDVWYIGNSEWMIEMKWCDNSKNTSITQNT